MWQEQKFQTSKIKSLQRHRQTQAMQKNTNQAKMPEFEGIQAMVNQPAIQAVTAVMMVL